MKLGAIHPEAKVQCGGLQQDFALRAFVRRSSPLVRQFTVPARDKAWVTDITYIRNSEGFAYRAGVIDLNSRRIIGLAGTKPR